jgi:hypothetical protein
MQSEEEVRVVRLIARAVPYIDVSANCDLIILGMT